jgi:hypothetical protein
VVDVAGGGGAEFSGHGGMIARWGRMGWSWRAWRSRCGSPPGGGGGGRGGCGGAWNGRAGMNRAFARGANRGRIGGVL